MILDFQLDKDTVTISLTHDGGKKPSDVRKLDVHDYDRNIYHQATWLPNSMMPAAVRYADMNAGIFVFERPPAYVPFNFSPAKQHQLNVDGKSRQDIRLPIPWQQYVVRFGRNGLPIKMLVFFSNQPLESLAQPLMRAPIPNLYQDGSVCLPVYNHVDEVSYSLIDAISNAYEIVWRSGFNMDVFQCSYEWWNQARRADHLLCQSGINLTEDMVRWYKNWSFFSVEDVVEKMKWNSMLYESVYSALDRLRNEDVDNHHETVVDLYLASR